MPPRQVPICATGCFGELCLPFVCGNLSFLMVDTGQIKKYLPDWLPNKIPTTGHWRVQTFTANSSCTENPTCQDWGKCTDTEQQQLSRSRSSWTSLECFLPGWAHTITWLSTLHKTCSKPWFWLNQLHHSYQISCFSNLVLLTPASITHLLVQDPSLFFLHAT